MSEHDQKRICLGYFGRVDPHVCGIDYSPITAPRDEPYVAISSYFMVGLQHGLRTPEGYSAFMDLPYAPELRSMKPAAVAGRTIFVFSRQQIVEAANRAIERLEGGAKSGPGTPR